MSLLLELRCMEDPAWLAQVSDVQALLSPSELQRWQQFQHPKRQQAYLAGRALARQLLSLWPGMHSPSLRVDAQGRSSIEGRPDLYLSISHSGGWVACAVADVPLGLDIEDTRRERDFWALAQAVHSPAQGQAIERASSTAEQARLFYQWWTLKEARFKRQGQGLDLAQMPKLDYAPSPGDVGTAAVCFLPQCGLMLALDGDCCERAALTNALTRHEGDAACWQVFVEVAQLQSASTSKSLLSD